MHQNTTHVQAAPLPTPEEITANRQRFDDFVAQGPIPEAVALDALRKRHLELLAQGTILTPEHIADELAARLTAAKARRIAIERAGIDPELLLPAALRGKLTAMRDKEEIQAAYSRVVNVSLRRRRAVSGPSRGGRQLRLTRAAQDVAMRDFEIAASAPDSPLRMPAVRATEARMMEACAQMMEASRLAFMRQPVIRQIGRAPSRAPRRARRAKVARAAVPASGSDGPPPPPIRSLPRCRAPIGGAL